MSRIGKMPVVLPAGVSVHVDGGRGVDAVGAREIKVKGPKGELALKLRPEVDVTVEDKGVLVQRVQGQETREARAFHGMTRALVANMVLGVTKGFQKTLDIQGVGWNASVQGDLVLVNLGYSQPVRVKVPAGIQVQTPSPTSIVVSGADKQGVGQLAASIRKLRPPEPYKGKGVRYLGEVVKQKAGKSFGS